MAINSEESILARAIENIISQSATRGSYMIRQATQSDAEEICEIARSATERFTTIPALADLLEHEDISPPGVYEWLDQGRICLVTDGGRIMGFAAAHPVDRSLYIDEISVWSRDQGRGIGGLLMTVLFEWARERQRSGVAEARVSLTTYADVPWNGPWYARRGFREVPAEAVGPAHVRELELDGGERHLTRPGYRRCVMVWDAQ